MATSIVYNLPSGQATSMTFDASPEQVHDSEADVTEDPVEQGAPLSDHVRALPKKLQIEATITNTPIAMPPDQMNGITGSIQPFDLGDGVKANLFQWSGSFDRVKTCHEELLRLQETGTLVTLVTSLRQYDNCVIASISVRRNATIGDSADFTLGFEQVRIVQTQTAAAPATPRATRRGANGNRTPTAQPAGQPANAGAASALANLTGGGVVAR